MGAGPLTPTAAALHDQDPSRALVSLRGWDMGRQRGRKDTEGTLGSQKDRETQENKDMEDTGWHKEHRGGVVRDKGSRPLTRLLRCEDGLGQQSLTQREFPKFLQGLQVLLGVPPWR